MVIEDTSAATIAQSHVVAPVMKAVQIDLPNVPPRLADNAAAAVLARIRALRFASAHPPQRSRKAIELRITGSHVEVEPQP